MSGSALTGINRSMIASLFHFLGELLADFYDLRADHGHAVALLRVLGEVLLMIVLGDVEGPGGDDLGDDGVIEDLVLREGSDHVLGDRLLVRRVVEDRRPVLRADVMTLAVERGRIVDREEDLKQLAEGDHLGVERDLHRLGVAGAACADRLVSRIRALPADVAGLDRLDALHPVIDRLQAPEAPAGQRGYFFAGWNVRTCVSHDGSYTPCQ